MNAKYIHSNPGVYSLCACAGKRNPDAKISTLIFTINQDIQQVIRDIYVQDPGLVGFSCYIWNISMIKKIVTTLRKVLPDTQIWLGGPEVSYCAEEILKQCPADGIMVGEGELTFADLVREYLLGSAGDYRQVKGIVTREFATAEAEMIPMDELPFIYRDFPKEQFDNRILYYESSRGCPYGCTYCLSSVEKQLRFKSLDKVYEELQFFLDHKVRQVKFVDRTFNSKDSHALAIWRFLKEHDNGVTNFHFEIAAETLSEEALTLITSMRPGLLRLEIGVQSTCKETLKAIRRVMDVEKCKTVAKTILEKGNVKLHLDLIAGLPGESYRRFLQSFNEIYSLHPHELQLGFLKVLKGTPIAEEAEKTGIVYETEPPYEVLFTPDISYAELLKLKAAEEMLEIYYNSGQFGRSLAILEDLFETPYALYEALADFYKEKGYGILQQSRLKRYEILLEFYETAGTGRIKDEQDWKMKECLLYDLYARENLKKRPAFAGKQTEEERLFYRGNKQLMFDTHVEAFTEPDGAKRYLLFDYRQRDPVTENVIVTDITDEINERIAEHRDDN